MRRRPGRTQSGWVWEVSSQAGAGGRPLAQRKGPGASPTLVIMRTGSDRRPAPFLLQLHPLVLPQVSHLRQVPLRTMVKFWHSGQLVPS